MEFLPKLIHSHAGFAYLSLILLLIRGFLSQKGVNWRQSAFLRIAPHAIDTLLLLSGAWVVYTYLSNEIYTFGELSWLLGKFACIILYIVFSVRTFKRGSDFKLGNFLVALAGFVVAMMIAVMH